MRSLLSQKPGPAEYPAYAEIYMRHLKEGTSLLDSLTVNEQITVRLLSSLSEESLRFRYAPGKWTVKDILCHISDDERIYAYRALRFARSDNTVLSGFDQDDFARHASANKRSLEDLLREFSSVRLATITLLRSLDNESLLRGGIADGNRSTVRALAYHIAGHELHHIDLVRRLYIPVARNGE